MSNVRLTAHEAEVSFRIFDRSHSRSMLGSLANIAVGGSIRRSRSTGASVVALRDISLDLAPGDRLAVVGRNGAGKSTLLKVLSGVLPPTRGSVEISGTINNVLSMGQGFDMERTGRDNIRRCLRMNEIPTERHKALEEEVADFAEIGHFLDLPVRTYSSGMLLRVMVGIQTAVSADIFIADEIIGAGDLYFMDKARERVAGNLSESKIVVLATHSSDTALRFCNKGLVLHKGRMLFLGPVQEAWEGFISGKFERELLLRQ